MVGDIGVPYGGLFFQPIMSNSNDYVEKIVESVKGISVDTIIITEVITGRLAFRRYDGKYSTQYETLVNQYKLPITPRVEY